MIRVLLDENLPRKLKGPLDAENATVPERGWGGIKNGDPLRIAEKAFDVLLTVDKGLRYPAEPERTFHRRSRPRDAEGTNFSDLLPLVPAAEAALRRAKPGQVIIVKQQGHGMLSACAFLAILGACLTKDGSTAAAINRSISPIFFVTSRRLAGCASKDRKNVLDSSLASLQSP